MSARAFPARNTQANPKDLLSGPGMMFNVSCFWTMSATMKVRAENEQEAIQKAKDYPTLPKGGEYLGDSFDVAEAEPVGDDG